MIRESQRESKWMIYFKEHGMGVDIVQTNELHQYEFLNCNIPL